MIWVIFPSYKAQKDLWHPALSAPRPRLLNVQPHVKWHCCSRRLLSAQISFDGNTTPTHWFSMRVLPLSYNSEHLNPVNPHFLHRNASHGGSETDSNKSQTKKEDGSILPLCKTAGSSTFCFLSKLVSLWVIVADGLGYCSSSMEVVAELHFCA